jgi:hypothetical protein
MDELPATVNVLSFVDVVDKKVVGFRGAIRLPSE